MRKTTQRSEAIENWDRSRLIYLKEHDMWSVSDVAKFIEKTIKTKREEERKKILDILDGMEDKTARNVVLLHLHEEMNPLSTPTNNTKED